MKYFFVYALILTCMFSCIKVSSQTSSVGTDVDFIYTAGELRVSRDGEMINTKLIDNTTKEIPAVKIIMDILGIKETLEYSDLFNSLNKKQMLEAFSKKAESISDNTTLYWFYVGHGVNGNFLPKEYKGETTQEDEDYYKTLSIDEIMTQIQKVRKTPFKRFIIMTLACTSGDIFRNLKNYQGKVFNEALVFTSASSENSQSGRYFTSIYTALKFLKLAVDYPQMSVQKLVQSSRDYDRFSGKDVTGCTLIKFADDKSSSDGFSLAPYKSDDCKYEKEPVTISSRSHPTYKDLYNLLNYLSTNEDDESELKALQYPQLFSYPDSLKNEPIWKD